MNLPTLTKFFTTATHDRWSQGLIHPGWNKLHQDLEYANKPFNDDVTVAEWRGYGLDFNKYTGDIIDYPDLPEWVLPIAEQTGLDNIGASLYRMNPGCILPNHSDTYQLYKKFHNITHNRIFRVIVFLEEWASGHYFEVDGTPITGWQAGYWVGWHYDTPHLASNLGITNRYTMQITGTYN